MSWSINFIGNPDKIVDVLNRESGKQTGKSKEEFDAALPHMAGLLAQNYNNAEGGYAPTLQIIASGHGHDKYNYCTVEIKNLGGSLV